MDEIFATGTVTLSWQAEAQRLLPGEDVVTTNPRQVRRWLTIYTELIEVRQRLIITSRELMTGPSDEANTELDEHWMPMLQLELEHFQRRLAFWQGQARAKGGE